MEENHCRDCCCAQSWKALGVTTYTGKSIPEHIEALIVESTRLRVALIDIVNPLAYLQREAENTGMMLSGMAVTISQDPEFLKDIARRSLKEPQ